MMKKCVINIGAEEAESYPVMLAVKLFDIDQWLPRISLNQTIVIITDHMVRKYYGLNLQQSLVQAGYRCLLISFPAGEKYKTHATKQMIEEKMLRSGCDRTTLIVALGGGIVGDLAGFVAGTYFRGISYIQIPTTLLAMVDSSVGGKTAINTAYGKNLIGMIYQPTCVVADVSLLVSLSRRNFICGLIEAIKMFLTHDYNSFRYVSLHLERMMSGDEVALKEIVKRSVRIKAGVVNRDVKDHAERNVLNFGHTVGHALEKVSNYTILHGFAVAYGILVESAISHARGLLDINQLTLIRNLFKQLGIQGKQLHKYQAGQLIQATRTDKKARSGVVNYSLLSKIGRAHVIRDKYIHPVSDSEVRLAIKNTIEG